MYTDQRNRRNSDRLKLHMPLRYQVRGTTEFNTSVSEDISPAGLGFTHGRFIAPKTMLTLEIKLLSRVIRPVGAVAWASPMAHSDRYRLGIEFLELDTQERTHLKEYLNLKTSKQFT